MREWLHQILTLSAETLKEIKDCLICYRCRISTIVKDLITGYDQEKDSQYNLIQKSF